MSIILKHVFKICILHCRFSKSRSTGEAVVAASRRNTPAKGRKNSVSSEGNLLTTKTSESSKQSNTDKKVTNKKMTNKNTSNKRISPNHEDLNIQKNFGTSNNPTSEVSSLPDHDKPEGNLKNAEKSRVKDTQESRETSTQKFEGKALDESDSRSSVTGDATGRDDRKERVVTAEGSLREGSTSKGARNSDVMAKSTTDKRKIGAKVPLNTPSRDSVAQVNIQDLLRDHSLRENNNLSSSFPLENTGSDADFYIKMQEELKQYDRRFKDDSFTDIDLEGASPNTTKRTLNTSIASGPNNAKTPKESAQTKIVADDSMKPKSDVTTDDVKFTSDNLNFTNQVKSLSKKRTGGILNSSSIEAKKAAKSEVVCITSDKVSSTQSITKTTGLDSHVTKTRRASRFAPLQSSYNINTKRKFSTAFVIISS